VLGVFLVRMYRKERRRTLAARSLQQELIPAEASAP
jgi:hypothetical protein